MRKKTEEYCLEDEHSPDFDFRHHLRDTIILLGGEKAIADLLIKSQDGGITAADIDSLRRYNCGLIDANKRRLVSINKMTLLKGR
jgi:hypothetical protein